MARDPYIEARLWNWARYLRGGSVGGTGYATVDLLGSGGGGRSGYREAVIPVDAAEAAITGQAVDALDPELRRTVHEYYLAPGTDEAVAGEMQIAESTLRARLGRAHACLLRWFGEREERLQQERARVEQLQRGSPAC